MNETELIAAVFSLLSVWFSTKSNILCWPFGIIGIIAYIYVFRDQGATSNMILQSFFVIQSIYGWVTWKKEGTKKISLFNEELSATITTISILNTSPMKMQNVIKYMILLKDLSVICFLWCFFSSISGGKDPLFDGITAGLTTMGMIFLAEKKIESWLFWIVADVLYIPFFIIGGHYISAITYCIFLGLATFGFMNWVKIYRNEIQR